jgi:hypothetical protein
MTDDMTEMAGRIARLEALARMHTAQLVAAEDCIADLRDRVENMGKRKKLPYLELIPPANTITQVRAELFHNEPKQGVPAIVLKLFVWTCPKDEVTKHKEGNSQPFYLYLGGPADLKPGDGRSQIERVIAKIGGCSDFLLGCLNQRRKQGNLKGQRRYMDYAAVVQPNGELTLLLNGDVIECGMPVALKDGRSNRASKQVWYYEQSPVSP